MSETPPSLSIQAEYRYRGPSGGWLRDAALYSIVLIVVMWWERIYGSSVGAKMIVTVFIIVAAVPVALWLRWMDVTAGGDGIRIRKRSETVEFSFADISRVVTTSDADEEFPYPPWLVGPVVELRLKSGRAIRLALPERQQGEFLGYLVSRGFTPMAEAR